MFELQVVSSRPMTDVDDLDVLAFELLRQIGYLSRAGTLEDARGEAAFRLFVDCFLRRGDRAWTADEMAVFLETSKPTVYRHLSRLKDMDLLEAVDAVDAEGRPRKGYRFRYGDLSKAWGLAEANVEMAMRNYRRNIDHLQKLADHAGPR